MAQGIRLSGKGPQLPRKQMRDVLGGATVLLGSIVDKAGRNFGNGIRTVWGTLMDAEGEVWRTCGNGSWEILTPTQKMCGGCQSFIASEGAKPGQRRRALGRGRLRTLSRRGSGVRIPAPAPTKHGQVSRVYADSAQQSRVLGASFLRGFSFPVSVQTHVRPCLDHDCSVTLSSQKTS